MSTSPTPPEDGSATGSGDWKKSVSQSYRSEEVRSVAKVLASLEPGATSTSKMMLAMRFEESIFQQATSLPDYRKKLTKRLKKLQKNYKPTQDGSSTSPILTSTAAASTGAAKTGGAAGGGAVTAAAIEAARRAEEKVERELRAKFGKEIMFIVEHAVEAVVAMREKHGAERADHLRQHTDNVEQWAVEIGLNITAVKKNSSSLPRRRRVPREPGYLERLKSHLEQRVDNIRSHVVKLTQPDLFLEETLVRLESDMNEMTAKALATATNAALARSGLSIALASSDANSSEPVPTPLLSMRRLLERAAVTVPVPRRGHKGDARDAALARIEKLRAAAQALMTYMSLSPEDKTAVGGSLKRCHTLAVEALQYLGDSYESDDEDGDNTTPGPTALSGPESKVKLEDAWNKVLEYSKDGSGHAPSSTGGDDGDHHASIAEGAEPDSKRPRLSPPISTTPSLPTIVMRSKVLLRPGRKVPSNLLAALRRKRAQLHFPHTGLAGTKITLDFGTAFVMTIYFLPLLVTIRAMPQKPNSNQNGQQVSRGEEKSNFRRIVVDGGLETWTSPRYGLASRQIIRNRPKTVPLPSINTKKNINVNMDFPLSVLGIPGTYATIGPLIAKKLEYASAVATHVLRRCFADVAGKCYASPTASDFETEISEATALLQFVQIARLTYVPNWQDG